ncbi:3-oxoacyl-[acyl-carrier protein] reductase [Sulfobacillus thermosulfidooxidans DSM 9293]|uniref:3-oxoacyl-[acyl-carrier protein] reductase n=1 Tax=Sulfobacillus thermosulfidooxidans (strain DSM 9293 / VKM B-1269 / AT-1) TaxID=929705 RepID=A0A1W1WHW8_SULTA|nr:SDR family oxidoreductase [Sulfobacillus thermosulfidooxidans]SMC05782.1 3-oxoacyl-[acyl-carrier protein] reductase [Sulfobacillus thermosulfidooxidans DSM 9293]
MDLELTNQIVVITGGSRGIGYAVAEGFLQEGAHVALIAQNRDRLKAAQNRLQAQFPHQDILAVVADLSAEDEAAGAVSHILSHFEHIDVLINNAGNAPGRLLEDLTDEMWEKALSVKFLGYVRMMRQVLPIFQEQAHGVIVNVIGNDGTKYPYWEITGTAANAADLAVSQALAKQYGRYHIRINSVNPGPVETDRWWNLMADFARDHAMTPQEAHALFCQSIPIGRIATPQEVANVVLFLASPRASFVHGTVIAVDGDQDKSVIDWLSFHKGS